jgi:murein DD-endopeptidase MepM/ murein hydrolase activator NlpD
MAGNRGFRRSFKTPAGYRQEPGGRTALFNQTYLGFVKNNEDALMMGRLQVWIPEFSSNPDDESTWFTVSYCSPFAGATPAKDLKKGGQELADTQQSYGWWAVPPDLDNEVVVMFINGDPNRGVWIGALYQQYMNHMVPGIASAKSFKEGGEGVDPPVAEYNKWGSDVGNNENPTRPRFEPLHQGIHNQGLYPDPIRGPTDSSARRASVSHVYGFKTPAGSQFVFDDGTDNPHIRLRTASGAQIMINETAGFVYLISANGNSWLEVSDDGVDIYSAKSVSLRAQGDFNVHSDGAINMYAKKSFNVYGGGGGSMQFGRNLDVLAGGTTNISSAGNLNLMSQASVAVSAGGKLSLQSGGVMGIGAGGALGLSSGGHLVLSGAKVQQNSGSGTQPSAAAEASGPQPAELPDRELNASKQFPEINTKTIVSRLVTHEPFDGHPVTKADAARARVDLSVSSRDQVDGNGNDGVDPDDIQPGEEEIIPTDNATFVAPASGPVTSLFGPRNTGIAGASRNHKGVDLGIPRGTSVVAMRDGTVTKAGWGTGYGNVIYIKHDEGYETRYAHLTSFNVRPGTKVKQGQVIGKSGNTGVGSGPHLHFEIRKNGSAINPNAKLKNIRKGSRLNAGRN